MFLPRYTSKVSAFKITKVNTKDGSINTFPTQRPFEGFLLTTATIFKPYTTHVGDICLRVTLLRSFSSHVFSKSTNYARESAVYNSIQIRESNNGLLISDTVVAWASQRTSWEFTVLYRTFDWLDLKIGHLIGWIWKRWNLLFQFCHLVGFHCLGGPVSVNAL